MTEGTTAMSIMEAEKFWDKKFDKVRAIPSNMRKPAVEFLRRITDQFRWGLSLYDSMKKHEQKWVSETQFIVNPTYNKIYEELEDACFDSSYFGIELDYVIFGLIEEAILDYRFTKDEVNHWNIIGYLQQNPKTRFIITNPEDDDSIHEEDVILEECIKEFPSMSGHTLDFNPETQGDTHEQIEAYMKGETVI
jgi:hypothetical protein